MRIAPRRQDHRGPESQWVRFPGVAEDLFHERWRRACSTDASFHNPLANLDEYWDRARTVEEVARTCPTLLYAPRQVSDLSVSRRINQVLRWYVMHLNEVCEINEAYRTTINAHNVAQRAFRQTRLMIGEAEAVRALEQIKDSLEDRHRTFWSSGLQSEFVVDCTQPMVQERNLDTSFQRILARIFWKLSSKLKLRTITNLIVLTYICADLVEEGDEGELVIKGSTPLRGVTSAGVYEKLRKGHRSSSLPSN